MKNKNYSRKETISQNKVTTPKQEVKEKKEDNQGNVKERKHPKLQFALKLLIFLILVIAVVHYTDKKGYFTPKLTYHERFEASSFMKFTETDSVDVLIVGNSIAGAGINCHMLSNALGANVFSYFTSSSDLMDAYFTIKSALTRTTPKVLVVETFAIGDILTNNHIPLKRAQSFMQRVDTLEKIKSMPYLFSLEEYWGAWSTTIRNHDFLFRDTAQIRSNIDSTFNASNNIYLGDSNCNVPCISDSADAVYDKEGPMIDCAKTKMHDFDEEYIQKIKNLCDEKHIKLVFLTIPLYYKHIKDYPIWRAKLEKLIKPTKAPWADYQANYDKEHYTRKFFEKQRRANQHMVYAGAIYVTHQFAAFLKDSLKLQLPHRDQQKHWHDIFYGTEGYLFNYSPRDNDTSNYSICNDKVFGQLKIKNAFIGKQEKANLLLVKLEKSDLLKGKEKIKLLVKGEYQGKEVTTVIDCNRFKEYTPINYETFNTGLIKEFRPKEIMGISAQ